MDLRLSQDGYRLAVLGLLFWVYGAGRGRKVGTGAEGWAVWGGFWGRRGGVFAGRWREGIFLGVE